MKRISFFLKTAALAGAARLRLLALAGSVLICGEASASTSSTTQYLGSLGYEDEGDHIEIVYCNPSASGTVVIPSSINGKPVTTIGYSTFYMLEWVTGVTIPGSVTTIESNAFSGCRSLKSVTIPGSVATIESFAFSVCADLQSVTIQSGVTTIEGMAFSGCENLQSVTIPASVTSIKIMAFAACSKLESVTFLGNAPTYLGMWAFEGAPETCKIRFSKNATGFSTPLWCGFPTEFIGASVSSIPAPEITVKQGTVLADGISRKNFGIRALGKKGLPMVFTIKNDGTAPLKGLSVSVNGRQAKDFKITQPGKTSLSSGTSTTFRVTFKPSAKGARNAAIHIRSNDANESPFDVKLTGKGKK